MCRITLVCVQNQSIQSLLSNAQQPLDWDIDTNGVYYGVGKYNRNRTAAAKNSTSLLSSKYLVEYLNPGLFYFQYFMQLTLSTGHDWSFEFEWMRNANNSLYQDSQTNTTNLSYNESYPETNYHGNSSLH